ncbi:MAG: sugar phosphate nucleotidyltransferase [Bacteroidetes bacterium]|nr:sugar phosphate nucleotidyltransferase [Bacteroidota bacterium]
MNIIVPMAGMGKRMRPHTLTVPKPLIPVAGKSIVQRLVEDLAKVCSEKIDEVAFVIGDFGKEVENELIAIATSIGAKGKIFYQREAMGTAHAVYCAQECLKGNVIVAFADTLFRATFKLDSKADGIIWVHSVSDPSAYGVVKLDANNHITDFIEKPKTFVSDLAIIGIYYVKDGDQLNAEIKHIIDNDLRENNEYQLTNALEALKQKGVKFAPGKVDEWLDCGNKNATVNANQRVLEFHKGNKELKGNFKNENSVVIEPCYIADGVELVNSVVGPHVSIGNNTIISNSIIKNSIVQKNTKINNSNIHNSMVGNFTEISGTPRELSVGDYNTEK